MRGDSGSTGSYTARGATHDLSGMDSSGALMELKTRGNNLAIWIFKKLILKPVFRIRIPQGFKCPGSVIQNRIPNTDPDPV
jgi:hypothetical protein